MNAHQPLKLMDRKFKMKTPFITMESISFNSIFIAIGIVLTVSSYLICMAFGLPISLNLLEFAAVSTSYTCTILFLMQKRVAYYYGVISTAFLCLFFYMTGVYALAIFNGVLVFSLVYGFIKWGPDRKAIPVTELEDWWGVLGYTLFGILVAGFFILVTGSGVPLDIILASLSAVAQLMLDRKVRSNWLVWILVNVISIYFFYQSGMYLLAIQFVFFLINAIVAWVKWGKDVQ